MPLSFTRPFGVPDAARVRAVGESAEMEARDLREGSGVEDISGEARRLDLRRVDGPAAAGGETPSLRRGDGGPFRRDREGAVVELDMPRPAVSL